MTISTTTSRWESVGNGSTTIFPYNNKIFADTDLVVYLDGVLQTLTTHYTVSGAGDEAGGNVTFVTAPALSAKVVVVRSVANTQLIDYPAAGAFPSVATENGLDRRTIISQQNASGLARAIQYLESDSNLPSGSLPTVDTLKGRYLRFNAVTGAPEAGLFDSGTATRYDNTFSGDGATVAFTLSTATVLSSILDVYISGVHQAPSTYSVSGTTLTFTAAPPVGTNNIYVGVSETLPVGDVASSEVNYTPAGTGAVDRTVQSRLREKVSVKDFGAVGDGVTDDRAAIQAALDASNEVHFPVGTYIVNGTLYLRQLQPQLIGEPTVSNSDTNDAYGGVKLVFTGTGTACVTQTDLLNNIKHWTIRDMIFRATGTYSWIFDFMEPLGGKFINAQAYQESLTGGCWRSQSIVATNPSWVNWFDKVLFKSPTAATQYICDHQMSDSFFHGCYFGGGYGTIDRTTGGNSYIGNHFDLTNSAGAGLTIAKGISTTGDKHIQIVGNYFDLHENYAILLHNDTATTADFFKVTITANTFRNPLATADIYLKSSTYAAYGSSIVGNSFTTANADPLLIDPLWTDFVVSANSYGTLTPAPTSFDVETDGSVFDRTLVKVHGPIAANASKTLRGESNVSGMFYATAGANDYPLLLGSVTGVVPFIAAGQNTAGTWSDLAIKTGGATRVRIDTSGNVGIGTATPQALLHVNGGDIRTRSLQITDGMTAPTATVGEAKIYVDTADGDLKIIFGDGTVKTIVVDT